VLRGASRLIRRSGDGKRKGGQEVIRTVKEEVPKKKEGKTVARYPERTKPNVAKPVTKKKNSPVRPMRKHKECKEKPSAAIRPSASCTAKKQRNENSKKKKGKKRSGKRWGFVGNSPGRHQGDPKGGQR